MNTFLRNSRFSYDFHPSTNFLSISCFCINVQIKINLTLILTINPKYTQALTTLENIISRLRDLDDGRFNTPPSSPARQPRSSPASPACSKKGKQRHQSSSPIRQILNSPLLNRRQRHKNKQQNESSDDENLTLTQNMCEENSNTSIGNGKHYRDLETFQKAQLRQKVIFFLIINVQLCRSVFIDYFSVELSYIISNLYSLIHTHELFYTSLFMKYNLYIYYMARANIL